MYIDEDHLAVQKHKGRKHIIMPVAVIAVGRHKECKGRMRLTAPVRFACIDTEELLKTIEGFICSTFDLDALELIRVHGDGAAYICRAPGSLPQTVHVHDGFHVERAIRRYCRRAADTKKEAGKLRASLKAAVKAGDQPKFPDLLNISVSECSDESGLVKNPHLIADAKRGGGL